MSRLRETHPRLFALGFIALVALGVVGFLAAQVLLPYYLGLGGLLLVGLMDLALYLGLRRRKRRGRPRPAKVSDPAVRDAEIAAATLLVAVAGAVYTSGMAIRIGSAVFEPSLPVFLLGAILTLVAMALTYAIRPPGAPGLLNLPREEELDTTEDH